MQMLLSHIYRLSILNLKKIKKKNRCVIYFCHTPPRPKKKKNIFVLLI